MRLIDVSELKEWVENWFVKNRFYHPYAKSNNIPTTELYDILEQMPTIEERKSGKWIPCSERLPEEDGWYEVTYISTFLPHPYIKGTELDLTGKHITCFKKFENGKWGGGIFEGIYNPVIAWNSERIEYIDEPYEGG